MLKSTDGYEVEYVKFDKSYLKKFVYSYLALPYCIFFLVWLKFPISIVLCVVILVPFFVFYKRDVPLLIPFSRKYISCIMICGIIICALYILTGAGAQIGIPSLQSSDYNKHNAIIRDLVLYDWPVQYRFTSSAMGTLNYYCLYNGVKTLAFQAKPLG